MALLPLVALWVVPPVILVVVGLWEPLQVADLPLVGPWVVPLLLVGPWVVLLLLVVLWAALLPVVVDLLVVPPLEAL